MKNITLIICGLLTQFLYCQADPNVWTLVQTGTDIYNGQIEMENWSNRWDIESLDMHAVEGGFLTCGYYNDQILDSTDGNDYDLSGKYGAYLAKYNNDGVIQWVVRTEKASNEERNVIMSIATDSQGNIYIVGHSDGVIFDATGVSQQLFQPSYSPPFLIKLTPNGQIIWKMIVTGAYPKKVEIDNQDNVIVAGEINTGGYAYINNVIVSPHPDLPNANYYIAKYSPAGVQMWDAGIYIHSVNAEFIESLSVDANNNIFVHGAYELDLKVYNSDEINYIQKSWSGNYGGSMFLAKYIPTGSVQWVVTSVDAPDGKIVGTPDGSHYICGSNESWLDVGHTLTNADGSTLSQNQYGSFYLAKVNANGYWEWVTGASECDFGSNYAIAKHGNTLKLVGTLTNWGSESASLELHGNNGYADLTVNSSDMFLATYDFNGNLLHLSKSGDNESTLVENSPSGLYIDNNGYWYLQRNMWFYLSAGPLSFCNQTIQPTLDRDAVITKFKPTSSEDVILKTEDVKMASMKLLPNPNHGKFRIELGKLYMDVRLSIADVSGKVIAKESFVNASELSAEFEGASGIYFVTIETDSQMQLFKVVKI